jgi:spastic paraplegia 7
LNLKVVSNEKARKQSPSIIYIDEIDAIGRKRSESTGGGAGAGGSGESDQTLNQLLSCMDGLESDSNVIVIASTNRADVLDKALLRPGRLDRHITISLPTHDERIEIFTVHMKDLKCEFGGEERLSFTSYLAHLTPTFSGADIANICNESALIAVREGCRNIQKKHFISALERVVGGAEKKNSTISVEEKKMIAYHECGHVIMSWFLPNPDLVLKVSLLSRTKTHAFSQFLYQDKKLQTQGYYFLNFYNKSRF